MSSWQNILSLPMRIIKSPADFVAGTWQDGGRGQFLVMGLPSVIVFVFGIAVYLLAATNVKQLNSQYAGLLQKASENVRQLNTELQNSSKIRQNTGTNTTDADLENQEKLKQEQTKERIYLQKLIYLEPDRSEHKFNLAKHKIVQGDLAHGLSLLQMIAPFDKAGYPEAHLTLAHYLLSKPETTEDARRNNRRLAKQQVENCLVADKGNRDAKRLLAMILVQENQLPKAFEVYRELFETDPIYYRELMELAAALGKTAERNTILDRASYQFRQKINKSSDNVTEWVDAWTHYVICMKLKDSPRSYQDAENAVKGELLKFNDDVARKVFLKRQLSRIYSDRATQIGREAPLEGKKMQLSDLAKSLENDPKNELALQWLTQLGYNPELGEEARKVYDPQLDPNPPWVVLSEMGHQALRQNNYDDAITYFERARKKNPREPTVLNNLAYALLVSTNPDPERALLLVDQAIVFILESKVRENRGEIFSSFYDTRGVALMQLERYVEAAAAFETAFQHRPNSLEILDKLIQCYEGRDDSQAESYRRERDRLAKEKS